MFNFSDFVKNIDYSNSEKSAMSSILELAHYNDISYSYELIKEEVKYFKLFYMITLQENFYFQGPPHNKIFTITLYLGNEQYTSEMKSIKKAQQAAASMALKNTQYEHPPVKLKADEKALTPTVLLNNLAAKLGLAVTYTLVTDKLLVTIIFINCYNIFSIGFVCINFFILYNFHFKLVVINN